MSTPFAFSQPKPSKPSRGLGGHPGVGALRHLHHHRDLQVRSAHLQLGGAGWAKEGPWRFGRFGGLSSFLLGFSRVLQGFLGSCWIFLKFSRVFVLMVLGFSGFVLRVWLFWDVLGATCLPPKNPPFWERQLPTFSWLCWISNTSTRWPICGCGVNTFLKQAAKPSRERGPNVLPFVLARYSSSLKKTSKHQKDHNNTFNHRGQ